MNLPTQDLIIVHLILIIIVIIMQRKPADCSDRHAAPWMQYLAYSSSTRLCKLTIDAQLRFGSSGRIKIIDCIPFSYGRPAA